MDRSGGIGFGDGGRWSSEWWFYPGDACEDRYAVAVFYYNVSRWGNVVYM
jgi:hypothetical protein